MNPPRRRWTVGLMLFAAASFAMTCGAFAQQENFPPAPLVSIAAQPAPRLLVDASLPEQLAHGLVVIRYRAEHLRIVPVFGQAALDVSPRIGHVHVTVDDAPWHWADASGEPLIIQGLPAGPHRVLIELADPTHKVVDRKTVELVIPPGNAGHH